MNHRTTFMKIVAEMICFSHLFDLQWLTYDVPECEMMQIFCGMNFIFEAYCKIAQISLRSLLYHLCMKL